jgi:hypothetical protein
MVLDLSGGIVGRSVKKSVDWLVEMTAERPVKLLVGFVIGGRGQEI